MHGFQKNVSYWALATCFPVTELAELGFCGKPLPFGYFIVIKAKERRRNTKDTNASDSSPLTSRQRMCEWR